MKNTGNNSEYTNKNQQYAIISDHVGPSKSSWSSQREKKNGNNDDKKENIRTQIKYLK